MDSRALTGPVGRLPVNEGIDDIPEEMLLHRDIDDRGLLAPRLQRGFVTASRRAIGLDTREPLTEIPVAVRAVQLALLHLQVNFPAGNGPIPHRPTIIVAARRGLLEATRTDRLPKAAPTADGQRLVGHLNRSDVSLREIQQGFEVDVHKPTIYRFSCDTSSLS